MAAFVQFPWGSLRLACRVGFFFVLAAAAVPFAAHGFSSEVVFAAADANGSTQLLRIKHAPLSAAVLTQESGTSAGLTVCGGAAFWAVNNASGTRLLRFSPGTSGLMEVGKFSGTNASTSHLVGDGQVVYWSVTSGSSSSLSRTDNLSPSTIVISQQGGVPVALAVENQEAFWAVNFGTSPGGDAVLFRSGLMAPPASTLIHPNGRITGMAVDQGWVWLAATDFLSPAGSRIIRKNVVGSETAIVHQISGTTGPIVASQGRGAWTIIRPDGTKGLFSSSVDAPNVQQYPDKDMPGNDGLVLAGARGVWWAGGAYSMRFLAFKLFEPQFYQFSPEQFPAATFGLPAVRGESLRLCGAQSGGFNPYLRLDPDGPDFTPFVENVFLSPTGVGAGRDFFYVATSENLWAESQTGQITSTPLNSHTRILFASGEAQGPLFLFAANPDATTRTLFASDGSAPWQIGPGPLGSQHISFPEDIGVWNDRTVFTTKFGDLRFLCGVMHSSNSVTDVWAAFQDPGNIRAFQGYLLTDETDENGDPMTVWNGPFGQGTFGTGLGPSIAQASNTLYFRNPDNTGLISQNPTTSPQFSPFPIVPAVPSGVHFRKEWGEAAFFEYETASGLRALFSHDPRTGQTWPVMEAETFGEMVAHKGRLYFTARWNDYEAVYSLPHVAASPEQIGAWFVGTRPGLHSFVSLGSTLYAIAEDFEAAGDVVVVGDYSGFIPVPGNLQEVTALRRYRSQLLAITAGDSPQVLRKLASSWSAFSTGFLSDPADFLETGGALYFSALQNGERRLVRLTPEVSSQAAIVGFATNPRSLTVHKSRLWLSAQSGSSRELFSVVRPTYLLNPVSSLGASGYRANPLIDGPRPISFTASEVGENLPQGTVIGEVAAADPFGMASFTLVDYPSPSLILEGTTIKLANGLGSPPEITFQIEATNTLGISNRRDFTISVVSQLDAWLTRNFPSEDGETGAAAPAEDPDGDGLVNQIERAFTLDPTGADGSFGLPVLAPSEGTANAVELTFHTPLSFPSDLSFEIQSSIDLIKWTLEGMLFASSGERIWTGSPSAFSQEHLLAEGKTVFRYTAPLPSGGKRFLRVKVTKKF